MRTPLIALVLTATLAACETGPPPPQMRWWHASATRDQAARDVWECQRDASMAAPPSQQITSRGGYRAGEFWIPPSVSSFDAAEERRSDLFRYCLMARGYRLAVENPFPQPAPLPAWELRPLP